jgi:DNA recombination protein RmuC
MFDSTSVFWLLLGLGAGVGFGWLGAKLRSQKRVTELSTILEIERTKNADLAQTFEALSDRALRQNNQTFFELANQKLGPLQKSLDQFDSKVQEIEKARAGAYAGVTQQISSLLDAQNELRTQTANLVGALKTPRTRGRWGEIHLKRVVEMAGMLNHCDFFEQESGDGPLRPDMTVHLRRH